MEATNEIIVSVETTHTLSTTVKTSVFQVIEKKPPSSDAEENQIIIDEKSDNSADYTNSQNEEVDKQQNATTTTHPYNPNMPDEIENSDIMERLRGDAIGNTLYSQRFVISTLLKLGDVKKPLENDENFEKDLEALWDMTVEKDVVLMLLQFDVYDIFTQCLLKYSNDVRLIEILIGIMGNMCSVSVEALQQLTKNEVTIEVLIQLITADDSEVLIQLMRLYAIGYGKDSATLWNQHIKEFPNFAECFCFILTNSCNTNLLLHSLEVLNVILAKNASILTETTDDDNDGDDKKKEVLDFIQTFVSIKLSESIKQGFLTFHANENVYYTNRNDNSEDDNNEGDDFTESISGTVQKAFIMFLNIEEILFDYVTNIFNEKTETELKSCLLIIISTISTPIFVLPSNFGYLHSVLEVFKEFFVANALLHDEIMVDYVANIWEILRKLKSNSTHGNTNGFDEHNELDEETIESLNKLFQLTHEVLKIMLKNYDIEALEVILRRLSPMSAFKLLEAYGLNVGDYIDNPHITTEHCEQLKIALGNMV